MTEKSDKNIREDILCAIYDELYHTHDRQLIAKRPCELIKMVTDLGRTRQTYNNIFWELVTAGVFTDISNPNGKPRRGRKRKTDVIMIDMVKFYQYINGIFIKSRHHTLDEEAGVLKGYGMKLLSKERLTQLFMRFGIKTKATINMVIDRLCRFKYLTDEGGGVYRISNKADANTQKHKEATNEDITKLLQERTVSPMDNGCFFIALKTNKNYRHSYRRRIASFVWGHELLASVERIMKCIKTIPDNPFYEPPPNPV